MRHRTAVVALLMGATACSQASETPRPDLVDVESLAPSIVAEMRYASTNNFVGDRVDGYEAAKCLLSRPAAEALAAVQQALREDGLGLLVYDCYRPQRAVDHFVRWAADTLDLRTKVGYYPDVPKSRLFEEGYIAERSGHSRASTIDLTVGRLQADGSVAPLDMGSPFDFFDPVSHTESPDVSAEQHANRLRLREAMEAGGFDNYVNEWWHYTLDGEPYPDDYFDVPVR